MALTADRITEKKLPGEQAYPIASNKTIFAGSMVAIDADGKAVPAADAEVRVQGIAQKTVVNPSGGSEWIEVEWPIVALLDAEIDGETPFAQTDVGLVCYVVDDHTVSPVAGAKSVIAGQVMEIVPADGEDDHDRVWVSITPSNAGFTP